MKYIGYSNVSPAVDQMSAFPNINLKEFVDKWCRSYIQINIGNEDLVEAIGDEMTDEQIKEKIMSYNVNNSTRFVFCYDWTNKTAMFYNSADYTNIQSKVEGIDENASLVAADIMADMTEKEQLEEEIFDEQNSLKELDEFDNSDNFPEFDAYKNTSYLIPLKKLNDGDTVKFDLYEEGGEYNKEYRFVDTGTNEKTNCMKCDLQYTNKCTKFTPCYNGYFKEQTD